MNEFQVSRFIECIGCTGTSVLGTVGRPMPSVNIRIVRDNPASPSGYDTLVEADSEHTKVEVESKSMFLKIGGECIRSL